MELREKAQKKAAASVHLAVLENSLPNAIRLLHGPKAHWCRVLYHTVINTIWGDKKNIYECGGGHVQW